MPVKNEGSDAEGDGDVSGAESEHSNSSQAHESTDENENDSDVSELDANDIERRRAENMEFMSELERQFAYIRELYYRERMTQIDRQLNELRNDRSEEYLIPLKELDKTYSNRIEVAEVLRKLRLENIDHKYQSEIQAAHQHFESEKQLAIDQIHDDLIEKIRRLEEDRHNVDISWADWGVDKRTSKVRGPGRKKAVTVTGPFIVYMLSDEDIMEDWTTIRKAIKRSTATVAGNPTT